MRPELFTVAVREGHSSREHRWAIELIEAWTVRGQRASVWRSLTVSERVTPLRIIEEWLNYVYTLLIKYNRTATVGTTKKHARSTASEWQ